MAELSDTEIDLALERGRLAASSEPRAAEVRFNRKLGRVVVELTNGCSFAFPPRLAQGLESASDDQIARVEILGSGYGLHWEELDVDLSVPGLLGGLFGTRADMAKMAGRTSSPAKAAAARVNGANGGRQKKAG
jgi:hypothetical protein